MVYILVLNSHAGQWRDESFKSGDCEGALTAAREIALLEYEHYSRIYCTLHVCFAKLGNRYGPPLIRIVLAEDAIKSALKDYRLKREKSAASAKPLPPDAQPARAASWAAGGHSISGLRREIARSIARLFDHWIELYVQQLCHLVELAVIMYQTNNLLCTCMYCTYNVLYSAIRCFIIINHNEICFIIQTSFIYRLVLPFHWVPFTSRTFDLVDYGNTHLLISGQQYDNDLLH